MRSFPIASFEVAPTSVSLLRVHERFAANLHFGWLVRSARLVAVKRLHPMHSRRAGEETPTRLRHPNVVRTLGIVRRRSELLAAMEYVPGASLAEICDGYGAALDPRVACAIVAGALRGLHAAREARMTILPRDLSRSSVLVGEDGRTRLFDLDVRGPTTAASVAETLPYASPEQLVRRDADRRRDVYAASVLLWETLTGKSLFRAPTVESTVRKILSEDVPSPSRFAPWIHRSLDAIVMRGLARDPRSRFMSAYDMAIELERSSCATPFEVARALRGLDLSCITARRVLADAVLRRESNTLHIECTKGVPKE